FDLNTDRNSRNCELTTDSVNIKGKTPLRPQTHLSFLKRTYLPCFYCLVWLQSAKILKRKEQILSLNTAIVKIREKLPLR
ncbi:unnamed protein product, partial [Porites evermanni]